MDYDTMKQLDDAETRAWERKHAAKFLKCVSSMLQDCKETMLEGCPPDMTEDQLLELTACFEEQVEYWGARVRH